MLRFFDTHAHLDLLGLKTDETAQKLIANAQLVSVVFHNNLCMVLAYTLILSSNIKRAI